MTLRKNIIYRRGTAVLSIFVEQCSQLDLSGTLKEFGSLSGSMSKSFSYVWEVILLI